MDQPWPDADFEALLHEVAAPALSEVGYAYDPRLDVEAELWGFRKPLGDDVQSIVQFQRRAVAAEFTVNLRRLTSATLQPHLYGGDAEARGARLSDVLWFIHHLQVPPAPDYWWPLTEAGVRGAVRQTIEAGVPWLEAPHAIRPWEMPAPRGEEFAAAVRAILDPELGPLGYRFEQRLLAGQVPYPYAVKKRSDEAFALIELQATYSLDPAEFTFDVRLQLNLTPDPLTMSGRCVSLAQLAWLARGGGPLSAAPLEDAQTVLWRYTNRAELDAQLRAAVACLKEFGLPWLAGAHEIA